MNFSSIGSTSAYQAFCYFNNSQSAKTCFSIGPNKIFARFSSTLPTTINTTSHYLDSHSFTKPLDSDLKKHIWAVHATKVLPNEGALHPFFDHTRFTSWPSLCLPNIKTNIISNTIHFALGGLVPSYGPEVWEHHPFAVITPLGTIIEQAVNIFAHDTIIVRKWNLKKESILLVPEGTNTSTLQGECFKTVSYNKSKSTLRMAVDNVIREKQGLLFKMPDQSALLGCEALLGGKININTPIFFEKLLNEYSGKLSFGDGCHSKIGDVYLLGWLRFLSGRLLLSKNKAEMYATYILLKYMFDKAKNKYFTQEERLRIEKFLVDKKKEIPTRSQIFDPTWPFISPEFFHDLTWEELNKLKDIRQDLFEKYNQHEFEGSWAACRWFVIGYQEGLKEGLDEIIDREFDLFLSLNKKPQMYSLTLRALLNAHNKSFSDRLQIVASILKIASVQKYRYAFVTQTMVPMIAEPILKTDVK